MFYIGWRWGVVKGDRKIKAPYIKIRDYDNSISTIDCQKVWNSVL
jgi:hypothetical protein